MISIALSLSLLVLSVWAAKLCDQFQSTTAWPYMFNNNAWNKVSESSLNAFYSTWEWKGEPPAVKAFPNVEYKSPFLPLQLKSLQTLRVAATWSFAPSSLEPGSSGDPNVQADADAIATNGVQANVVLDVFGDEDEERSQTPSKQGYEFMVWVGQFGSAALPLGNTQLLDPAVVTRMDETDFTLYNGTNSNGQKVFSWVANHTLTSFDMDFAPLLGYLAHAKMVSSEVYLGSVQFGTETFYSPIQMNFSVEFFKADLQTTNAKGTGTMTAKGTLPVATQVPTGHHHNLACSPRSSLLEVVYGAMFIACLMLSGCVMLLC